MHSYQPVNHPNNDAHRFRHQHPSLEHKPISPHFRPPNQPHSNFPINNTIDIKPHPKYSPNFILNQEESQKYSPNVFPQKNQSNWNKQAQHSNNCSSIQLSSFNPNQQEMKFKFSNLQQGYRRGSQGVSNQDLSQSKVAQRRSQSIVGIRQKLTNQESQKDNIFSSYRPHYDYATANDARKTQRTTSPFMFNFNAQQIAVSSNNIRQKEQRDKGSSLSKKDESLRSSNNVSSAPRQSNFRSAFEELRPKVSNYVTTNDNVSQHDGEQSSNHFKHSTVTVPVFERKDSYNLERKSSSKDLVSHKTQNNNISTIQRDIELLKNAAKHTNQAFQKELSKNAYLSRLLEEKSNKINSNDPSRQVSENNDSVSKIYQLQKDLDEKSKQICDKNKQIWDKSKIIIDKNKIIDNLSNELRQCRRKLEEHEGGGHRKYKEYDDKLNQHIQENKDLKQRLSKVQEALNTWKEEKALKQRQLIEKNKKIEELDQQIIYNNSIITEGKNNLEKLSMQILELNQSIGQFKVQNVKFKEENNDLKQTASKNSIELFDLKSDIIAKENQILALQEEAQVLRQKITQLEAVQCKSSQQTANSREIKGSLEQDELRKKLAEVQEQQQELSNVLLKEGPYDHQKIIAKLKQLSENSKVVDTLKTKEQQRVEEHQILKLHQDYYEKKCYEINRQLKRTGNKLLGVSHEIHQGNKLLCESNHQIILFNLNKLNEKYKAIDDEEA